MRIWSLHPMYLDAKGLVALWRETLLAKKVLENKTNGYKNHPQLIRFRLADKPHDAINFYLTTVYHESLNRKYHFDKNKIGNFTSDLSIPVTDGQIKYEFKHLMSKLKVRDPERYKACLKIGDPQLNPLFRKTKGKVENWEKPIV
jgi:hypothetical protein